MSDSSLFVVVSVMVVLTVLIVGQVVSQDTGNKRWAESCYRADGVPVFTMDGQRACLSKR